MNTTKHLFIVRSLSGGGKSTLAKQIAEREQCYHLEADMYFVHDGVYKFNAKELGHAHKWCYDMVEKYLVLDGKVVVSNTFTTLRELLSYFRLAAKNEPCLVSVLEPSTLWKYDVTECFKRNTHNVPIHVLEAQLARWVEIPEGLYDSSDLLEKYERIARETSAAASTLR